MAKLKKKKNKRKGQFAATGYDALDAGHSKRKQHSALIKHEDESLKGRHRRTLQNGTSYLYRNFPLIAWAVRKHLDFVTQFTFQVRTGDEEFDAEVEALMKEFSLPFICDSAARMNLNQILRTLECRRLLDGDCFLLLRNNGQLAAIEGDRIQDPTENAVVDENWFNGCNVDSWGKPRKWCLHNRKSSGGYEQARFIAANNLVQHAAFDRFDQVRGVSPMVAATNSFTDVYEGIDFSLAKLKVEQFFALMIRSSNTSGTGDFTRTGDGLYEVDFGKGPVHLELDNDDTAEFLKSDNPGANTREFLELVMTLAIKCLDLPIIFTDEGNANFSSSRAAWLLYERSLTAKHETMLETLRRITVWKLRQWVMTDRLSLPADVETIYDISYEWIPVGLEWNDPAKEIDAKIRSIRAGLTTPQRVTRDTGNGDYFDNVKQIELARKAAEGADIKFDWMTEEASEEPAPQELEMERGINE